jgi:hypothetical protein
LLAVPCLAKPVNRVISSPADAESGAKPGRTCSGPASRRGRTRSGPGRRRLATGETHSARRARPPAGTSGCRRCHVSARIPVILGARGGGSRQTAPVRSGWAGSQPPGGPQPGLDGMALRRFTDKEVLLVTKIDRGLRRPISSPPHLSCGATTGRGRAGITAGHSVVPAVGGGSRRQRRHDARLPRFDLRAVAA